MKLKLLWYIPEFIAFYLAKLVQSNLQIAWTILSPRMKINPGFIDLPLTLNAPGALLLFSNLLSMTPGSLSCDISGDMKFLRVHLLIMEDENSFIAETDRLQKRIERITKLL